MSGPERALFSLLFFLSGAAGLIYEVCWTRLLRLPMGNTVASLTTVLTAFMAGLALGSWVAGRRFSHSSRPLRIYAVLEAAIGLFCLALPWIVAGQEPFFRWVYRSFGDTHVAYHALRFSACAAVILIPATLMGATLPVLCRAFFDAPARIGRSIGWLYAVNAFGAVAGSLLAGFVLIPSIGQHGAIFVGVAISLTVAAVAGMAARGGVAAHRDPAGRAVPHRPRAAPATSVDPEVVALEGRERVALLMGYGLSGLAAMVLQIAWTRVLALAFGSSVYAFALLVAAFILGLALGSSAASRFADRIRRPALGFAAAELGIGFAALATVAMFQQFPEWIVKLVPQLAGDFSRFQLVQFALTFGALLLPTVCMGACLPLVGKALARDTENATETVGTAYSANAIGTIVGAFFGGFVLLPALGMHHTILVGAIVNLGVGIAFTVWFLPRPRGWIVAAGVAFVAVAALFFAPPLDPTLFTSGAYLYADRLNKMATGGSLAAALQAENRIILNREGVVSTITVKDYVNGARALFVNGKTDASDDMDMPTQQLLGHIPALVHGAPKRVAVIGLASGATLAAIARHPGVESIDCIEIAPEMSEACRLFDHVNGAILDDPRVRVIVQDGRNHLALTDRKYDLIVSEPSNPWIAGIASLFTEEFFRACRDRLEPGGVVGIWMQTYGLDLHSLRSIVRTFQSVFPQSMLWETIFASDYQLIGSALPLAVPYGTLQARLASPRVAEELLRLDVRDPAELLQHYVAGGERLQQFAATGDVYRDDRNRLEFDAPRLLHQPTSSEALQTLQALRQPGLPPWVLPDALFHGDGQTVLEQVQRAQALFFQGVVCEQRGDDAGAMEHFLTALETNRSVRDAWPQLLAASRSVLRRAVAAGDKATVAHTHRRIQELAPPMADYYNDYGLYLGSAGRLPEAERAYGRALRLRPGAVQTRLNLATALVLQGQLPQAAKLLDDVLRDWPAHLRARMMLGNLRMQQGDSAGAEQEFSAAVRAHPDAAQPWFLLGEARRQRRAWADAVAAYTRATKRDAHLAAAYRGLAHCYEQLGETKKAADAMARTGPAPP